MRPARFGLMAAVLLITAACTTERVTHPGQTATQQLLLSNAVDEAVNQVGMPPVDGKSVFFDASGITGDTAAYAKAALREEILEAGGMLVEGRDKADLVVEARTGALSIDTFQTLVGLPSYDIPVPLAGDVTTPEAALYKRAERRGIVKLALTAYEAGSGRLVTATGPRFGFSQKREWTVFFFVSWEREDLIPDGVAPSRHSILPPG